MNWEIFFKSYWNYFLELEENLLEIQRYINFEKNNWKVYSNEFIKLLEVIGAEVDIIAKEIVKYKKPNVKKSDGIARWGYEIQQLIPDIDTIKLRFNGESIIIPWKNWKNEKNVNKQGIEYYKLKENKKNPIWWVSYNKLKHERTTIRNGKYNYENANLGNVINALGGLYILETYFKEELENADNVYITRDSKLFKYININ